MPRKVATCATIISIEAYNDDPPPCRDFDPIFGVRVIDTGNRAARSEHSAAAEMQEFVPPLFYIHVTARLRLVMMVMRQTPHFLQFFLQKSG